jgi:hypothetical protein
MKHSQLKGLKVKLLLAENNKDSSKDEILELRSSIALLEEIQNLKSMLMIIPTADSSAQIYPSKTNTQIEAHIKQSVNLRRRV